MKDRQLLWSTIISVFALCLLVGCGPTATPKPTNTPTANTPASSSPAILIPLYSYPNWWEPADYIWDDIALTNSQVPIMAVINPDTGPGGGPPNSDYQHGLDELRQAGVTILGYVDTDYGKRKPDAVQADVDLYHQHFDIDGIFFDRVTSGADMCGYYKGLYTFVKSLPGMDIVVINPGTGPAECYFSQPICDIGVIFEGDSNGWAEYQLPPYIFNYPSKRFAVLVHTVPDSATMQAHIDLVKARNIGYVYLTNDTMDDQNPWDTLPTFWEAEIDLLRQVMPIQ